MPQGSYKRRQDDQRRWLGGGGLRGSWAQRRGRNLSLRFRKGIGFRAAGRGLLIKQPSADVAGSRQQEPRQHEQVGRRFPGLPGAGRWPRACCVTVPPLVGRETQGSPRGHRAQAGNIPETRPRVPASGTFAPGMDARGLRSPSERAGTELTGHRPCVGSVAGALSLGTWERRRDRGSGSPGTDRALGAPRPPPTLTARSSAKRCMSCFHVRFCFKALI